MAVFPIDPNSTSRSQAWNMWLKSPMPMVTITKTFNVSKLVGISKKKKIKFNTLLCYAIARAASNIGEFYMLPVKGQMLKYDSLGINVIVNNKKGGLSLCDVPYNGNLKQFIDDYNIITAKAFEKSEDSFYPDRMIIGTSAINNCELDCIQNQYSLLFNNPFLAWGKYRKHLFKTTLPISFQFHHVQMDGGHAATFFNQLQKEINDLLFSSSFKK